MVVDGSLDLPSLDEGMASILYAFAGFSFPFQGGFDGGHMFGTSVVSVNSSQRWATTTTPIRSRVVSKDAGHWLFVMSDSVVWYSSSQRPSLPMDKKKPAGSGPTGFLYCLESCVRRRIPDEGEQLGGMGGVCDRRSVWVDESRDVGSGPTVGLVSSRRCLKPPSWSVFCPLASGGCPLPGSSRETVSKMRECLLVLDLVMVAPTLVGAQ